MREIKFRAWDKENNQWIYFTLDEAIAKNNHTFLSNICQYTGLKDKNGKEIYEGDIITFHAFIEGGSVEKGSMETDYEGKGLITYRPDGMTFVIAEKESDWLIGDTTNYEEDCLEVIGNIYENPELVEPSKKTVTG